MIISFILSVITVCKSYEKYWEKDKSLNFFFESKLVHHQHLSKVCTADMSSSKSSKSKKSKKHCFESDSSSVESQPADSSTSKMRGLLEVQRHLMFYGLYNEEILSSMRDFVEENQTFSASSRESIAKKPKSPSIEQVK